MSKTLEERVSDLERRVDVLDDPFGKRLGPRYPEDVGPKAGDTLLTPLPPKGSLREHVVAALPVDRTKQELTDGRPVPADGNYILKSLDF